MMNTLGFVAGSAVVLGAGLAWLRLVPGLVGFGLFALGGLLGLVVTVATIIAVVRGRGMRLGNAVGLLAAAVLLGGASLGAGVPRINDFTTDLADPPEFRHAATLAPNAGRSMAYPADFAAQQKTCCPDLVPLRTAMAPAEAFGTAEETAKSMGWEVTARDPAAGTLEAVATTAVFGFHDDIVVRVRSKPEGGGSVVDVRSKSRDGQGDMGTNAERIRAFVSRFESAS
jgi:uncharacterized protein (DUF1499 family)